jgi:hypothetical protein
VTDAAGRAAPQASGRALAVLILGIASLVSCIPLPGIFALRLAPRARREIVESRGALVGAPLVRLGVACSWASFVFAVAVIGLIAVFLGLRD